MSTLPQIDLLAHGFGTDYAGGTATAYVAGTSALAEWFEDAAGLTLAANPYTLSVDGKAILYSGTRLKIDVKNTNGVSAPGFPVDNLGFGSYSPDENVSAVSVTGSVIQTAATVSTTNTVNPTITPLDNTVPQISEGTEVLSVSITPKLISSKFLITVSGYVASPGSAVSGAVSLFKNSGANSIAATAFSIAANSFTNVVLSHVHIPASLSPMTFTVNIGSSSNVGFNGLVGGPAFGGVSSSSIVVQEIKA